MTGSTARPGSCPRPATTNVPRCASVKRWSACTGSRGRPLLQVTIDTTDLADQFPDNPPLQVVVNNGVVYRTTGTPEDGVAVSGLDDRELFVQLALAEYAALYGGAGFDHPIDDLIEEIERRMPGALERLATRFNKYDAVDVVRAWFTDPDTLLAAARCT